VSPRCVAALLFFPHPHNMLLIVLNALTDQSSCGHSLIEQHISELSAATNVECFVVLALWKGERCGTSVESVIRRC
jgi:hypothetical protein